MRGFNYQNLNNGNLLLESGENLKQKWHKTTKKWHVKTYIHKSAMKISIALSQQSNAPIT